MKSRAFLLRRRASSPPPSERRATTHLPINIHSSVFGDTTIINLSIFYDAIDDVELIRFSNLQEASLHMSAFKMCVVKLRLYSLVYGTEKD